MYTKYVFESPKYDAALRDLQATLFGVVSSEEKNIEDLRTSAFIDVENPALAAELQGLYVQQDQYLRQLLKLSDDMASALQRLDHCARIKKQMVEKHRRKGAAAQQQMEQPKPVVGKPVVVSDDQKEIDEGDALAVHDNLTGAAEVAVPSSEAIADEVVMSFDDAAFAAKGEEADATDKSADQNPSAENSEDQNQSADNKEDQNQSTDIAEISDEVVMNFDDDAYVAKMATAGETAETENSEPVIAVDDNSVQEDSNTPVIQATEDLTEPTSIDDVPSEPLISPDVEFEKKEEAASIDDVSSEPLISPDTDPEVKEEEPLFSEPLITSIDTTDNGEPVMTTEEPVSEPLIVVGDDMEPNDEILTSNSSDEKGGLGVFKKRTDDPAKAIMVSKKQGDHLRNSLSTQQALLRERGFFSDKKSFEQQLVDKGLLKADGMSASQEEIELLMDKAKELYDAGKVGEAQAIYDQINELNKNLQGEEGASK